MGILKVLLFLFPAIPISVLDLRTRRIPDIVLLPGFLMAFWCSSRFDAFGLLDVCLGAGLGFLLFWSIWHLSRGKIGMGDVKYGALIGAFTGVAGLCVAVFVASFVGLLVALILVAVDRRNIRAKIPFAPFLSIGGAAALVAHALRWPELLFGGGP